jgi:uncharacterized membrane protein
MTRQETEANSDVGHDPDRPRRRNDWHEQGHGHAGGVGDGAALRRNPGARRRVLIVLALLLVPLLITILGGLAALWPRGDQSRFLPEDARYSAPGVTTEAATVSRVDPFICDVNLEGLQEAVRESVCAHVTAEVDNTRSETAHFDVAEQVVGAGIYPGDSVSVLRIPPDQGHSVTYSFVDFPRGLPLTGLALTFAALVALIAGLRGLLALVGLALSFLVIVRFVLPALLAGTSPLLVGVVGSAAIMFIVLYLAHGVSIRTTTALIGTLFGLGMAALLGGWAVKVAQLTGVATEEDMTVRALAVNVDLQGLLLCGIIIAGLGVLNDVTITQASAVWELYALQPTAPARRLFAGGMRIGRDHIASTVYTMAFAYAGSALPVLLLINLSQRPLTETLTSEALAQEIVSTLVGSIGLVLSVPLTTAVGVLLVTAARHRRPEQH